MATSSTPSPSKSATIRTVENFVGRVKLGPNCCFTRVLTFSILGGAGAAGACGAPTPPSEALVGDAGAEGDCAAQRQVIRKRTLLTILMGRVYPLLQRIGP